MTKDEALKLALEALKLSKHGHLDHAWADDAIAAIKQALAAPVQEPYGYVSTHTSGLMHFNKTFQGVYTDTATEIVAVYTTPPAAQPAVPLTDDLSNAVKMACQCSYMEHGRRTVNEQAWQRLMQAVAACAHGIKGAA
jgi:hypothetical protein